jgi:maltose alpha-D-glucosyltransferase/alpha-amylase
MASRHPNWLDNALFYEVYPQSFSDSNGDGIGDLQGIIKRLGYIKGLGFNAIWLNPIYDSPFKDAGYDVRDYKKVAPRYGTNQDAYKLFKAAHDSGMKVILDLVAGHTSIDHPWFVESLKPVSGPYTDRYVWTDSEDLHGDNEFRYLNGLSDRCGAVMTNFFSIQPALNYGFGEVKHPYEQRPNDAGPKATIADMIDVMKFWLSKGADGFRCDMAGSLVKRDAGALETAKVWQKMINACKKDYPDCVFVSEWGEPEKSLTAGFDMDFMLPQPWGLGADILNRSEDAYFKFGTNKDRMNGWLDAYASAMEFADRRGKFLAPVSGNHDVKRIASCLNDDELRLYYVFLFTTKGVPFLYYGDEIGMKYEEGLISVEGGYERTGSRSPMQWDATKNAGFTASSTRNTYIKLPVLADRKGISVLEETVKKDSLLNFVRDIISFRDGHHALDNDASMKLVRFKDPIPLVYERSKGKEKLTVAINVGDTPKRLMVDGAKTEVLFKVGEEPKVTDKTMMLAPHSAVIYR